MPNAKVSFSHAAHVMAAAHCDTQKLKAVFWNMSSSGRNASLTLVAL